MARLVPVVEASDVETIVLLTVALRSVTVELSISVEEPGK